MKLIALTLIGAMTYLSVIDVAIPGAFNTALIISVAGISGFKFLLAPLPKHLGMS